MHSTYTSLTKELHAQTWIPQFEEAIEQVLTTYLLLAPSRIWTSAYSIFASRYIHACSWLLVQKVHTYAYWDMIICDFELTFRTLTNPHIVRNSYTLLYRLIYPLLSRFFFGPCPRLHYSQEKRTTKPRLAAMYKQRLAMRKLVELVGTHEQWRADFSFVHNRSHFA